MAVKIRLKKMGSKKRPFYRLVAADVRSPRDGRFIELLGYYNPMTDPPDMRFDDDKVYKWLDSGAEPTPNAAQLLRKAGLLERWQLLRQGVKVSELDATIAERREKQPKPIPKAEKQEAKKQELEEKKQEEAAETAAPEEGAADSGAVTADAEEPAEAEEGAKGGEAAVEAEGEAESEKSE